jgi:hypothetical protein
LTFSFDPPAIDALPVKRLGTPPFWQGDQDFTAWVEAMYRAIGGHAYDLVLGTDGRHPGPAPALEEGNQAGRKRKEHRP